ncbi:hypothetical protein GCM10011519_33820 [Marmoricola endophyticus]|uniref:Pilus assembly protein n=1 Tax=Marmoricola endophyticus TaxID=2040280 RepID=A0A917F753_9ACTN|nr:hypothetical protein [Marmoricola endophyticus]GGF57103.1 hypothetical protein GCM10011519_33820 [Marmoricola endophyticus]
MSAVRTLVRRLQERRTDEAGTAIVELVWLAILLLVPLVYIVVAVLQTQRASYAATTAARSAGRAFVTSETEAAAPGRARAAAALAFQDQHVPSGRMRLTLTCRPDPANCLAPGSVVLADVRTSVLLPLVPDALGGNAPRIRVEASSRSPYGTFREDRP